MQVRRNNKVMLMLIIGLVILLFVACHSPNESEETFTGTIKEIYGQSAIVSIEEGDILRSGTEVSVDLSVAEDITFQVGDKVKVGYSGGVRESHPLGINTTFVERIE